MIRFSFFFVLGVIFIWFGIDPIVRYCSNKKWYQQFAPKFFFIYAFHAPLITFMIDPFLRLFDFIPLVHLFIFFTLPVVVIAVCVGLDVFIGKLFPSFYSLFTGGRGSAKKSGAINTHPAIYNHYQRVNNVLAKRYTLFANNASI